MPTDFELLEAWQRGDAKAGNELFERQFETLYRFFRTKVTSGEDDLIQEAMLECVKSAGGFEGRSTFKTFLFTIATRVLYRHFSRQKKDRVLDFAVTSIRDLGPSPSTLWAKREVEQIVLEALTHIPVKYQTILELYYWEDLSTDELAEMLEIPAATARTQLRRGRDQLATVLERLGSSHEELDEVLPGLRERAARV